MQRWQDNLTVQQKAYESMLQAAQRGAPLQQEWAMSEQTLGQNLAASRGHIEAIKTYLAQAQSAIAQGGSSMINFFRTTFQSGPQMVEQGAIFLEQHEAEIAAGGTGAIAATGQAIKYTVASGTATAAEGTAAAGTTAAAVGETTVAAGTVAETTVAAGTVAETTVAAVAADTTVAATVAAETAAVVETTAVATTAVAATEAGAGATLAGGAAGGSFLGPLGIAIGLTIAATVLTITYVATHKDDAPKTPVVAASTKSSDRDSSSESDSSSDTESSSESDSSSSDTDSSSSDSDSSSSDRDSSSSDRDSSSSSSTSTLGIPGRYVLTEDKGRFSPGSSDSFDSLGCAGRRLPKTIDVELPRSGFIRLFFSGDPGVPAFDHDGTIDSNNTFVVDYPDASGTEIEGRFELFGSEVDLLDGKYFTGDCTFVFTGTRQ